MSRLGWAKCLKAVPRQHREVIQLRFRGVIAVASILLATPACGDLAASFSAKVVPIVSVGEWGYDEAGRRLRLKILIEDSALIPGRHYSVKIESSVLETKTIRLRASATALAPFVQSASGLRPLLAEVDINNIEKNTYSIVDDVSGRTLPAIDTSLYRGNFWEN